MTEQAVIWEYYQNQRPESFAWGRSRLDWLVRRVQSLATGNPLKVFTVGAGGWSSSTSETLPATVRHGSSAKSWNT